MNDAMDDGVDKKLSNKYCRRFGNIAVEKGFISGDQLKKAISEQVEDDLSGRPHRMIGMILFEKNIMTIQQIDIVLNDLLIKWDEEKYSWMMILKKSFPISIAAVLGK